MCFRLLLGLSILFLTSSCSGGIYHYVKHPKMGKYLNIKIWHKWSSTEVYLSPDYLRWHVPDENYVRVSLPFFITADDQNFIVHTAYTRENLLDEPITIRCEELDRLEYDWIKERLKDRILYDSNNPPF